MNKVLDAALEQFSAVGIRLSTIEAIARRAGVDRVTVYRRVGSKDALVQGVVAREAARMFDQVLESARREPTLEDRLAVGFATMVMLVRGNPLWNRLVELEAGDVLPRLTTDATPVLQLAIQATMSVFEQAVEDGLPDQVENKLAASEIIVRVVHSFLMTPRGVLELDTKKALVTFGRQYLAPCLCSL